jgi:hypothetical protein
MSEIDVRDFRDSVFERSRLNDPSWLQRTRAVEPFPVFNPDCRLMGFVR